MGHPVKVWRSPKIEVRHDSTEGRGVFAVAPIAKDELVGVKVGHIVTTEEVLVITEKIGDFSLQIADGHFLSPRTADEVADMVLMINHSCDANVGFAGQVSYVAIRDIAAGEELAHDYAMARTVGPYGFDNCLCGATDCRGTITHNDWQLRSLQAKYGQYFSSHVLRRIANSP